MSKPKAVCAVGSAGLSVLSIVLLGLIGCGVTWAVVHVWGWVVVPNWLGWLGLIGAPFLIAVLVSDLYRLYFDACYRPPTAPRTPMRGDSVIKLTTLLWLCFFVGGCTSQPTAKAAKARPTPCVKGLVSSTSVQGSAGDWISHFPNCPD